MSLFESASLCVTPNGTKASKLYAIKPTDGAGDLSVTRATTATRVNSAGLIESVASNVPRLDYTNSTCPSILVEPQRTNSQTNSNTFTSWFSPNDGVTLTANTTDTLSPTGANNSTKVTQTGGNKRIFDIVAIPAGASTYSLFIKKGTGSVVRIVTSSGIFQVDYNLINKTVTATLGSGTITELNNGWFKITATATSLGGEVIQVVSLNNNGETFYIYGAQFESGSYATSYIPTTSASVTRNADVISKTGISSLIGQTEGTVFVDYFEKNGLGIIPLRINGSDGKFIWIRGTGAMFFGNSSALLFNNFGTPTANQRYKIAFVYGQNDFRLFVNGSFVSSVTTGTFTGTFSDVQLPALPNEDPFGQQYFVNSLQLYKTKLTNAELAELTTI